MKISVVSAIFNRADTVKQSLSSLHAQVGPVVEHIVIDGGSTDGTLDIIKTFPIQPALLVSEPDAGIYYALNKGFFLATGDIIGVLHSDDYFADERVLQRVATALCDPDVDGVYGDLNYVSKNDPSVIVRRWKAGQYRPALLARGWMPPHPTLFLRRSVIQRWGGFDTRFRIAADYDAVLRYLVKGCIRLAYIPEVLVEMRVGGESNRSLGRLIQKSYEDYQVLRRNGVGGLHALAWKNLSKLKQFIG